MRILIATGIFPPDIGGPATYSKLLVEEFSKRGHKMTVVTYATIGGFASDDKKSEAKPPIVTVSRNIPKGIRHVVYFWNILRRGRNADVIYAQDAVSAGFPAMIAARILRKRFFLKVVGDHAWEQGMQRYGVRELLDDFLIKTYGAGIALLRFFQMRTATSAEKIIVPSIYLKSVVERWDVSSGRIVVIPNAVSLPDTIFAKEEARKILGLEGFLLITIGRLVPWKGFRMLVELMPKLREVIPDIKLIIVGDGPEKQQLESMIKSASEWNTLKDNVFLTGSVSKDKLVAYLSAADVFLLNTGYEGFSHQLIEAMAMGVPVITTDAGGNKEVVRDGENALVAEYNNPESWKKAILRLYEDKELRRALSESTKDITERYSIENMIQKTESLILNS
ncbi:MAG: hypothetical protein A3J55_02005 [Candidatus Ryanbacteria bacterium RIFCSPHIGHO2_02_FULL_45_17b]|uniref:Glycosyltransferase subfamily 4-like N-terminal domain-containing protein n=1 Tax=Candidatus Ryanbacteria bacterium RIFCSPHIGHO2_01_FULL_45_22 TaxID=1802114 RepID=A0A1G2FYM4_9BACT|nr:MAG: hypothetical protein A2719_00450 [Candidatus Ryanbacteria bacterium RIFCSPHIGHO2_01_FULL_45_22]OGZ46714.1 MAG: hypothetical protein A3J55_02005 [Candidatus Ryanbacteria bacterium RIFCSPHIGHO2_02_FULL_45_17b]